MITGFFGAVFVALTMSWQLHVSGAALALPFAGFATIGLTAVFVIRLPGNGVTPSKNVEKAIMWSSVAEGVGLFLASNILLNLHLPDLLLPAMVLVVGLHFLPIAFAASFRPFYVLGTALIMAAIIGFVVRTPSGSEIAGFMAAAVLWIAAILAVQRDWRMKRSAVVLD